MQVKHPAPEFLLVRADPPAKSPGGLTLVTEKGHRPTQGTVVGIGHKAREEALVDSGDRILWTADAIKIVVEKATDDVGELLILHFENVRAVIQ